MSTTEVARMSGADVVVSMDTVGGFEALQRVAKLFAASDIVPPSYKGADGLPNAVIAVDMAMRMGANPLMVMQNLYVVHNRPAWSAQFLIATFNKCGRFSAVRYEYQGKEDTPEWGCRAVATELATGETLSGPLVTMKLAKAEGWIDKNGSKWKTLPELMLRYRAATFLIRTIAPEIAMGLQTKEEVEDTIDMERGEGGVYKSGPDRATIDLGAIKAGDASTHTAVDAPLSDSPVDAFRKARAKLSLHYEGNEDKIDGVLSSAVGMELQDIKDDCADLKVIDAVIELAKEF